MSYVIFVIISMSFVFSACNGTMNDLSVAALTSCKDAVTLCISLCGTICLWSGIMNVAGKSGIVSWLSKPLSLLFPDISRKGSAMQYIILNFISNLLGLGNASTPLGIKAMQELKEEQKAKKNATRSMIMLVVLNTASVQLFPSTVIALRASYASESPADILPCVWVVSALSLTLSVLSVFVFEKISNKRRKNVK